MSAVMQPHVVEVGLRTDEMPVVSKARQTGARFPPDDHRGVARLPPNASEHRGHRLGQRRHARTRLRVAKPKLAHCAIHVVPTQRDNLGVPTSRQHQQPDRGDRRRSHRAVHFGILQGSAEAPVLLRRQESLPGTLLVESYRSARIPPGWDELPRLGQTEHGRNSPDDSIGSGRCVAEPVMECRNLAASCRH